MRKSIVTVFSGKKHRLVAFTYFFINPTFFLSSGLLLTTLLSPFFCLWLKVKERRSVLRPFLVVAAPWILAHIRNGIDFSTYSKSIVLFFTVYVTAYAFYVALPRIPRIDKLFDKILLVNLFLVCAGLVVKLTPASEIMWIKDTITKDVAETARFRGLTYEPSYYSTLIAPLALWSFWKFRSGPSLEEIGRLSIIAISLAISFSFGVISGLCLTIVVLHLFDFHWLRAHLRLVIPLVLLCLVGWSLISGTIFVTRVDNVLSGQDSSGNARTIQSYILAYLIASTKSIWWGTGFGQIKIIGEGIIPWTDGRLPCAAAETFAQFGLIGIALRFGSEVCLLLKTRCYRNKFCFSLFVFMFIYQFTGSFVTNIAEYVVWILAFSPALFPEFSRASEGILSTNRQLSLNEALTNPEASV